MKIWPILSLSFALISAVTAGSTTCGNGQKCPESQPCCSQYGECGTGIYCLGACDPLNSFNSSACVPLPVCQNQKFTFGNTDSIVDQAKYLGDATQYGWSTNGQVLPYNGNILLTMANQSYGTVISSTRAVWYGKISATLQTSHGQGVVSAFILMSGAKDEIDYEFVGNDLDHAQTNFYFEGALNYTNSIHVPLSDTQQNSHTYEIDWTPDNITWTIDGSNVRTLNKQDTYNDTTKQYAFPQTPSIIQLSLWPGGSSLNAPGTIQWAGGPINWDMPEFKDPGYLYVTLKEIDVQCYDPPSGANVSGGKSYVYDSKGILEGNIEITNDDFVLGSSEACGFDMNKGKGDSSVPNVSQDLPTQIGQQHTDSTIDVSAIASSTTSIPDASASGSSSSTNPSETNSGSPSATTTSAAGSAFQMGSSTTTTAKSSSNNAGIAITSTSLIFVSLSTYIYFYLF